MSGQFRADLPACLASLGRQAKLGIGAKGRLMLIRRTRGLISVWYVVFSTRVPSRFLMWAIPGRWKHVSAFGHCEAAGTWIFIDPQFCGTKVAVVPDHEAPKYLAVESREGAVVRITAHELKRANLRTVGCCTMTIRHLVGLPGWSPWKAIPDVFLRDCLRAGGEVFYPRRRCVEEQTTVRPT